MSSVISSIRKLPSIFKDTCSEFIEDKVMKYSAALAYYTIFSLPSMLIVIIGLCGTLYGKAAIEGKIFFQLNNLIGAQPALEVQHIIQNMVLNHDSFLATVVGIITLLLGATGMFGEIQDSINTIWGLKTKPEKGLIKMLLNRLISFSMIIILGFILLVSLLLNVLLQAFFHDLKKLFPTDLIDKLYIIDQCIVYGIIALLFAFIFKVLPDAKLLWRDVWVGAFVTTILFVLGKFAISYYLSTNKQITAYGAAGSLIIILLWVYYSAIILYFGAEFTQVYAHHHGRSIAPNKYAIWIEKDIVEKKFNTQINKKPIPKKES
ncbi:MAG TPA: YihY/virulence factor BrkB family protein [Bacteroidia bacterium]|jgi:membrane protein|nr:YihY/virulence factor BrkB family protein [Bacteroidia bacterium]